jgi:hypothetical protein
MFRWYQRANFCYAYLEDFTGPIDHERLMEQLKECRWFSRGWTLQELIAANSVAFFTAKWNCIGWKASPSDVSFYYDHNLDSILSEITGISLQVLQNPDGALAEASIAQKMSWAARRETTREEDMAYCLLGLFGVSMAALYGEGYGRAFYRLQEEIIKTSMDQSIFAWRPTSLLQPTEVPALAESADNFRGLGKVVAFTADWTHDTEPSAITNMGVRIEAPIIDIDKDCAIALLASRYDHDCRGALGIHLSRTVRGKLFLPKHTFYRLNRPPEVMEHFTGKWQDIPLQKIYIVQGSREALNRGPTYRYPSLWIQKLPGLEIGTVYPPSLWNSEYRSFSSWAHSWTPVSTLRVINLIDTRQGRHHHNIFVTVGDYIRQKVVKVAAYSNAEGETMGEDFSPLADLNWDLQIICDQAHHGDVVRTHTLSGNSNVGIQLSVDSVLGQTVCILDFMILRPDEILG